MNRKLAAALAAAGTLIVALSGCSSKADTASDNLSKAADNFEIERRVVFINGITDKYLLAIEGKCSIKDDSGQLEVTCKLGPDQFKKHFLRLSDNVTYLVEQMDPVPVDEFHTRIIFKPEQILPDLDTQTSGG